MSYISLTSLNNEIVFTLSKGIRNKVISFKAKCNFKNVIYNTGYIALYDTIMYEGVIRGEKKHYCTKM